MIVVPLKEGENIEREKRAFKESYLRSTNPAERRIIDIGF